MKEDKIAIKFLRETKRYGAKRFLSEFPTNLFNRNILTICFITIFEFLIKCVVSHIAHDIHDRVELVTLTHCFSQYCDSKV